MIKIVINDEYNFISKNNLNLIKKISKYIFDTELIKGNFFCELNIINTRKMKIINNQYRNKDKSTDVITFAFWDSTTSIKTPLIGEIFICKEKVISQAKEYNHSIERELLFLICHGMYHLLGYDHLTKSDEEIMFKKQNDALNYINLPRNIKYKD